MRIVVWTWRWHLFSWWPSHHVWILVWIIGSFYLISQPCTYFFVALLYCYCTLFYIAHTFSIYCSAIQSAIELQICTVCYALNGQIVLQNWLTHWPRWGVLTQVETIITFVWLFANLSTYWKWQFFHLNILFSLLSASYTFVIWLSFVKSLHISIIASARLWNQKYESVTQSVFIGRMDLTLHIHSWYCCGKNC